MQTMASTDVWQRRTHRIIAMAVIIIGLTMMISTIPQCIYIGLIFIMIALGWLAWLRMREKSVEGASFPPGHGHGGHNASPVLFLVASHTLTQRHLRPTPVDPNDKPPSYDQIVKLDGLPPDYFTILSAKPPRYEDIEGLEKSWHMAIPVDLGTPMAGLAAVHGYCDPSQIGGCSSNSGCSSAVEQSLPFSTTVNMEGTAGELSSRDACVARVADARKNTKCSYSSEETKSLKDNS